MSKRTRGGTREANKRRERHARRGRARNYVSNLRRHGRRRQRALGTFDPWIAAGQPGTKLALIAAAMLVPGVRGCSIYEDLRHPAEAIVTVKTRCRSPAARCIVREVKLALEEQRPAGVRYVVTGARP